MQITAVEFENIKSYRREVIPLTPGLNAVCGDNGSGKTTILEAIGFALFDSLPYSQQAFLREGEKTGTVRVRILADDGREYEVVRRVGASGQYYVADVESGTRLAERGPNVLDWVRAHAFGIDGEVDLESLFENAVGVPQGKMTADFLGSTNTRKSVFNPLLRVEEYDKAWQELLQTQNNVRDRTGVVDVEIGRLEVEVQRMDELLPREAELKGKIEESEARIAGLVAELERVAEWKAALDGLHLEITRLQGEVRAGEYDEQRYRDRLQTHQASLAAALEARQVAAESEAGFQAVEAARLALKELEGHRIERDRLAEQRSAATSGMKYANEQVTALQQQIDQAVADSDEAAALAPAVTEQGQLDEALAEARMKLREDQRLQADMARLQREIQQLETAIEYRQKRIAEAQEAQAEAGRMAEVQQQQQEIVARLAQIASVRQQRDAVQAEGEELRKRHDQLRADVERRTAVVREIEDLAPVVADFDMLRQRQRERRDEQIRIQSTLDYQRVARADLEDLRCPLLELQCPVVTADRESLDRFDSRVAELAERLAPLETELASLATAIERAGQASQGLHTLQVEAARLESSESELGPAAERLEHCRQQYQELNRIVVGASGLEGKQRDIQAEMQRLQKAARAGAQLPVLEEQQSRDRDTLQSRRQELAAAAGQHHGLEAVSAEAQQLEARLAGLGDPRAKQQRLLAVAARRPQLESQRDAQQQQLQMHSDKLRALVAALQGFAGLDDQIEMQRRLQEANAPAYERYLQHRDEAAQVESRQQAALKTEQELAGAIAAAEESRTRLARAQEAYDADQHAEVGAQHQQLTAEVSAEGERLRQWTEEMGKVARELEHCRRQAEKLAARVAERNGLERAAVALKFIRETVKAAGPAITETLLSNISQIANDIYAEIMDDHAVELRWDRDFEIVVRRGPEDRKFAQLSGGEQMSAALAVRLALLKEMSEVGVVFFDEPTQNMDADRRGNLAGQIRAVRGFNQLIVISHDDTFEHHTDNLIRLVKAEDETRVEAV